ncbi:helix-turn-helix domain-containing protein [Streptomyces sp. G-G2]|uniref:helix-turn-helix domain-containing protein n=1 Tax=Streptomyces sp. G-G2 TaxID=3046201 RepID=UPI0024B9FFD9|nr:helix-turn-helix domain-containing protein [Streptomyces sp. G-G2]MDJ0380115.1 helix-turn-helix domain-containing protein [Streptomyces sp. G-G2]
MSFGTELRSRRQAQGLSIGELSKILHYSKGHLSRVETGAKRASSDLAVRCDDVLQAQGVLLSRLETPDNAARQVPGSSCRPVQIPCGTAHFVARAEEAAALGSALQAAGDSLSATASTVVISGMPGVGKTALALEWAHRNASAFPDGILFRELQTDESGGVTDDTNVVLSDFLQALGVDPAGMPAGVQGRAALYRSLLAGRKVLVVLDNAADTEQVRLLLPGSAQCATIVTSRSRLSGLVVRDGARRIALGVLSLAESCELLRHTIGLSPKDAPGGALLSLAARCGHLPLVLRTAAERYSTNRYPGLEQMAAELSGGRAVLDLLEYRHDRSVSLRSAFSRCYRALPETEARAFLLVAPQSLTGISVQAAAYLLGVPERTARRQLDFLYEAGLLELAGSEHYRAHALLGAYAAEQAGPPAWRNYSLPVESGHFRLAAGADRRVRARR